MLSAAQWDRMLWTELCSQIDQGLKLGFIVYSVWDSRFNLICKVLLTPSLQGWPGGLSGVCQAQANCWMLSKALIMNLCYCGNCAVLHAQIRLVAKGSQIQTVLKELGRVNPSVIRGFFFSLAMRCVAVHFLSQTFRDVQHLRRKIGAPFQRWWNLVWKETESGLPYGAVKVLHSVCQQIWKAL